MPIPTIDDRQLATDAAFNALLVTLHEARVLSVGRYRHHLTQATQQFVRKNEDAFQGTIAVLDELSEFLAELMPPPGEPPAGTEQA